MRNEHKSEYTKKIADTGSSQQTITSIFEKKTPITALPSAKKSALDKAVEDHIVHGLKPLSVVEDASFINLLKIAEPRYQMPARKTILSHMNKTYDFLVTDLKSQLLECPDVAFTHDIWTSLNTQSFGTTTVHFITKSWELETKVLCTKLFSGHHTGESIAENLKESLTVEWGLKEDGLIGVSDNAANEKKAFNILGWKRLSCQGHNLNLAVKAGLGVSEISRIVGKGRSLVSYFHKSPLAMDVLFKKQQLVLEPDQQGHKLIGDVSTRWNSTLDMLERLSEQTIALHSAVKDPSLSKVQREIESKLFSFDDQKVVDQIVSILKPFKIATVTLSSEKIPSTAFILPTLIKLDSFVTVSEDDPNVIKKFKTKISDSMNKRLPMAEKEICLLSSLLHPRTKMLGFLHPDDKDHAISLLEEKAVALMNNTPTLPVSNNNIKVEPTNQNNNDPLLPNVNLLNSDSAPSSKRIKLENDHSWLDDIIYVGSSTQPSNSTDIIKKEIGRYLNDEEGVGVAPLIWWKEREPIYPHLAVLAKKYLAIPASSVPSERIFSLAGNIVTKKRAQLSDENINLLIFLNKNQKCESL